jgi:DNA polymerase III epsilon subunit-like protein
MKLGALPIFILDTETTGLRAPADALCEIALMRWLPPKYVGPIERVEWSSLVNPGRLIPRDATLIHGIRNRDVVGAPSVDEACERVRSLIPPGSLVLAHNMAFDSRFIDLPERYLGCTLRLAKRLWPKAPSHKNANIARWLGIPEPDGPMHRALNDVRVTGQIFYQILRGLRAQTGAVPSAEELISLATGMAKLTSIPFGRYRGTRLSEVPTDYLSYALRTWTDADPTLLDALRNECAHRAAGR